MDHIHVWEEGEDTTKIRDDLQDLKRDSFEGKWTQKRQQVETMGDNEGNSDHEDKHGKRNEGNVGGSVPDAVDLDGQDAATKGS